MFKPVGTLIKSAPARSKTPDVMVALQVRQVAKNVLLDVCRDLPSEVVRSISVSSYASGALTVKAPTFVCAELQMRSEGLRDGVNKVLGRYTVGRIQLKAF